MDAQDREEFMRAMGMDPETEIDSGEEYKFGGAFDPDGDGDGDPVAQLARDWLEPESRTGKSRLTEGQSVAIPVLLQAIKYRPEYSEGIEAFVSEIVHGHLEASPAIDGEAREQAVEVLRAAHGGHAGGSGSGDGPGLVMRMAGAQEDGDE